MNNFRDLLFAQNIIKYQKKELKPYKVTIRPTQFPSDKLAEALQVQKIMNILFLKVLKDENTYKMSISDEMYNLLLKMRCKRKKEINCIYLRTDYLLNENDKLKQVEINSISIAFVFLNQKLNVIHSIFDQNTWIPPNIEKYVKMVSDLKRLYLKSFGKNENVIALLIDKENDIESDNFMEKKLIIYELRKVGIEMKHVSIEDLKRKSAFKNEYFLFGEEIVFFVYFRYFYNLSHYDEETIDLRMKIDHSNAISLPSVDLQLVGLKLFQMLFAKDEYLKKYLHEEEIKKLKEYFVEFKSFEKYEDNDEKNYVLKSTIEGGGNLITKNFKDYLKFNEKYFLMEKIKSKAFRNQIYSEEEESEIEPEIGVLGVLIEYQNEIVRNEDAGFIVRSKKKGTDECGISKGYGFLDSVCK